MKTISFKNPIPTLIGKPMGIVGLCWQLDFHNMIRFSRTTQWFVDWSPTRVTHEAESTVLYLFCPCKILELAFAD